MCLSSTSIEAQTLASHQLKITLNIAHLKSYRPDLNRWPHPYQGCALPAELLQLFASFRSEGGITFRRPTLFERKTGLEPATYSLEGYRSAKWATSASLIGLWGRVDSNHWTPKRTDLQSVAIATMRLPHYLRCRLASEGRADEGTRTPDRLITNQLLYQLSYIGFCQRFKQLFFSVLRLQRYYFFTNWKTFFQLFFIATTETTDLQIQ